MFDDLDKDSAAEVVEHLGVEVEYTESGGSPKTIKALVEVDVDYFGPNGELVGRFTTFEILKSEITSAVGATMKWPLPGGTVYNVRVPSANVPLVNDNTMAKLFGLP
jgi:hypothetical protein